MMPADTAQEFADHLRRKNHLGESGAVPNAGAQPQGERALHKLWSLTDLSANDFADEVAGFFQVPRVTLPDLMTAESLAHQFSQRFLREMLVFPFRSGMDSRRWRSPIRTTMRRPRPPPSCSAPTSGLRSPRSRTSKPLSTSASAMT